jgi:hypothetical protein
MQAIYSTSMPIDDTIDPDAFKKNLRKKQVEDIKSIYVNGRPENSIEKRQLKTFK